MTTDDFDHTSDDSADWASKHTTMDCSIGKIDIPSTPWRWVPQVDYDIPLQLPHGRVSAVVSPHKVRILENGVLRAQVSYSIAEGDIIKLEERSEPLGGEPMYVASVQKPDDEFPTPLVYWRPEPEPVVVDELSAASWWLRWAGVAALIIVWLVVLCWAAWTFAVGVMVP